MTQRMNIGLIGSGFMGQAHADAFRAALPAGAEVRFF